jgi:poly(A) polymerase
MVEPIVVPRAGHSLTRRDIDQDALKVLYRLRDGNFVAYLVGGSVRDLLLGRRPKDFDIGTSAHPYQIKRLFRNCWIIGRRFRLAHIKFGSKIIEVATFRRQVITAGPGEPMPATVAAADASDPLEANGNTIDDVTEQPRDGADDPRDLLIHRDNTFGTPEEDAFRRDFTINALFYDIGSFSIIDYVGGLADLRDRIVRCIGDPDERFREDPVRMLRAVALAERLEFSVDRPVLDAIGRQKNEIARSAPARLLEEYYKILRSGCAERVFRRLAAVGLLEPISPELARSADDAVWQALAALDAYRRRFGAMPDSLTNAILLGTLLVPLGFTPRSGAMMGGDAPRAWLGLLPPARRDQERLRHLLMLQRRLRDANQSPRAVHALLGRNSFNEAVTWLEVHGGVPELAQHWRSLQEQPVADGGPEPPIEPRPARRRRRRRGYRVPQQN